MWKTFWNDLTSNRDTFHLALLVVSWLGLILYVAYREWKFKKGDDTDV